MAENFRFQVDGFFGRSLFHTWKCGAGLGPLPGSVLSPRDYNSSTHRIDGMNGIFTYMNG